MARAGDRPGWEGDAEESELPYPAPGETVLDHALAELETHIATLETLLPNASEAGPEDEALADGADRNVASDEPHVDTDELGEEVREAYSELLDDYSDDSNAISRIRSLGRRIEALKEAGILARAFIRRGSARD